MRADCIERVVNTKTKEILYQKVSLSPRPPPKLILKEAWQVQRDDSHQRGTVTGKPVADEEQQELKIDYTESKVVHKQQSMKMTSEQEEVKDQRT